MKATTQRYNTAMQSIDTVIHARWVIPGQPESVVLEEHAVLIDGGRIIGIVPSQQETGYAARETVRLPHHALAPGLVNAHTHAAMTLLRGFADDLPLMAWLENHIWPAEAAHVSERFVAVGSELASAEMLLSGTTCFNDMYFFPNAAGRAAEAAGIRAVLGLIVIDAPTVWASDLNEYLKRATAVHDEFRSSERITTAFAPHAPYTVSDEGLRRVRVLADELDIPIHIHVHETQGEIDAALAVTGQRPLTRLKELELLSPRLLAVHMTQLEPEEIEDVAAHGVSVIHCPESNMKLASGTCPVTSLLAAGVNVALGTDGAASNNDLDMLGELRTAALVAKALTGDATALPAPRALTLATQAGADALGLGADIGSLEPGKYADIIAVDFSAPATQPMHNPISQLVYAASRDSVTDVWVGGERVVNQRALTRIDLPRLMQSVTAMADEF